MAMVCCAECGESISERALACPKSGASGSKGSGTAGAHVLSTRQDPEAMRFFQVLPARTDSPLEVLTGPGDSSSRYSVRPFNRLQRMPLPRTAWERGGQTAQS